MGLAAAKHLLNLGAKEVIITARSLAKGQKVKAEIEKQTHTAGQDRLKVMALDMSSYASITGFFEKVKQEYNSTGGLDFVILNAGIQNFGFIRGSEGWYVVHVLLW
jgi:NAD(P)-dependent dehydrogenase (short-subunit alcohol dehydrogenase family)